MDPQQIHSKAGLLAPFVPKPEALQVEAIADALDAKINTIPMSQLEHMKGQQLAQFERDQEMQISADTRRIGAVMVAHRARRDAMPTMPDDLVTALATAIQSVTTEQQHVEAKTALDSLPRQENAGVVTHEQSEVLAVEDWLMGAGSVLPKQKTHHR